LVPPSLYEISVVLKSQPGSLRRYAVSKGFDPMVSNSWEVTVG